MTPDLSILILSHNKPGFIKQAVRSVLDQTHGNWQAVLIDSGVLLRKGHFDYLKDERVQVIASGETPDMAKKLNMASWCFNKVLNSGMVRGELVMYLCDDDILYPEAFATFWNYYVQHHRKPQAMYASQDIGVVDAEGGTRIIGKRIADRPAGRFCQGRKLDCQVDYLQFCHSRAILEKMEAKYKTTEYHMLDRSHAEHADGVFMEKIGALTKVHNIDRLVSMNRRTTASINLEYADGPVGRFTALMKAKAKGVRRIFNRGY